MTTYFPPKKGVAFVCYVSLVSQANTKIMQANPTIASGDFKVSIDGGALANLTTLPSVAPAASKMVLISLSTSEMSGDNITIVCSDAAGAEWCDLVINLQTTARQIDDLAYPATSGRATAVDASGQVSVGAIANNAITAAAIAADAIGASELAADAVTEIQSGLATSAALVTAQADLDDIQTRIPAALVSGRIDASVGAMDADTLTSVALANDAVLEIQSGLSIPTAIENADALLTRDWTSVSGAADRSVLNALRFLRNRWSALLGVLTVYEEDDTTTAWSATVATSSGAEPVIGSDPT